MKMIFLIVKEYTVLSGLIILYFHMGQSTYSLTNHSHLQEESGPKRIIEVWLYINQVRLCYAA